LYLRVFWYFGKILKPIYDEKELQEHLIYVPKKLGLTLDEFQEIMNTPPRKYQEFSPKLPKLILEFEGKLFNSIIRIKRKFIKNPQHTYV